MVSEDEYVDVDILPRLETMVSSLFALTEA